MNADDLIHAAAGRMQLREPIGDTRRSRMADAMLVRAAEAILSGNQHGNDAEAISAAARAASGFSEKQAASMAGWKHDLILQLIREMLALSQGGRERRRGRPPKADKAMSGAQRQRRLQQRRREAEAALRRAQEIVREALVPIRDESMSDGSELTGYLVGKLRELEAVLDPAGKIIR